ncbi:head-tail connector protein [Acuticoccus mangrovi]|uniref:Phage head-tail connector protein n=1 Tax=Acuticoccus mangrovi TaxID=2796142 RepID=A0A934MC30_9HYPH|nr:head-tail connector protein [Acuticoccus mangrovi]MBJ3774822.1 phage head-tail connector protein [Acuticoccus mangrovi]
MVAILVTAPQAEPVTRDEAKAHARIDGNAEDGRVDALITAARMEVENRTGRALVTQGWRIVRDGVPRGGVIRLAPAPIQSVDAVTVYAQDGTPTVVSSDDYEVDSASAPGRLKFAAGRFWGARAMNGIEVDVTVGYGDPEDVPAPLKQAVLLLIAYWFEEREAARVGAVTEPVTSGVAALLAPYRMPRLA